MGHSSPTGLSGKGIPSNGLPPGLIPSSANQQSEAVDLIAGLRQSLAEGSQPAASIMHAAADAARILTGGDGVALALRTKGLIVCRARSGDLAPELGAPLNTDSGISGQCLRSASILLCHDTAIDDRVDPEVCRSMGVRSMVVVPLRGPAGIAGILEAFSARVQAFGDEQINALRALAEIAEAAYERECRALQEAGFASARGRTLSSGVTAAGRANETSRQPSPARRYWILAIAAATLLLVAGVWLSGSEPAETAASEPPPQMHRPAPENTVSAPEPVTPPKPKAGIERLRDRQLSAAEVLKNAADLEGTVEATEDARPTEIASGASPAERPMAPEAAPATAASTPEPPAVTIGTSGNRDQLAALAASPNTLPALDASVSQGITMGQLLHKVVPVYPTPARAQHIAGTVALEITIAEDGTIREVKRISGPPLLAAAATDAIRRWRYSSFLLSGKPIEVHKQVTIIFKLP
jgi:TonB family protein